MKKYVLDASSVLRYLLEEEINLITKRIEKVLKDTQKGKAKLFSSHLLPLEVGNGLRFTLKDEKLAEAAFDIFLKLPVDLLPFSKALLQKILSQSYLLKTTFYDTSYHLLAKTRGATFVTSDREYYKKAKELGDIEFLG